MPNDTFPLAFIRQQIAQAEYVLNTWLHANAPAEVIDVFNLLTDAVAVLETSGAAQVSFAESLPAGLSAFVKLGGQFRTEGDVIAP